MYIYGRFRRLTTLSPERRYHFPEEIFRGVNVVGVSTLFLNLIP